MQDFKQLAGRSLRYWLLAGVIAAGPTVMLPAYSSAQQPPAKAEPKAKTAPKSEPKGKAVPVPQEPQQGGQQTPQLTYTPWSKICQKAPDANGKQVCFVGREGRVDSGMPLVAAVLIEPEGDTRKILRVTLPLGMALQPGTRLIVDQGQPMTGAYVVCLPTGCMADYEASGELVGKLKSGQNLHVQGFNGAGQPVSLVLPLPEFAKAYDGPPMDPAKLQQPAPKPQ
ncbi:MAG: invasion associated locus B family protein [Xanthobacteraceae bacterium]